jgi:hypothetical protein
MKSRLFSACLLPTSLFLGNHSHAATYYTNVSLDLDNDGAFYERTMNGLTFEDFWSNEISIDPVSVKNGDTWVVNVSFANGKSLQFSDGPYGDERLNIFPSADGGWNLHWSVQVHQTATLEFHGVNGDLNSASFSDSNYGGGTYGAVVIADMTSTMFSFTGFTMTSQIISGLSSSRTLSSLSINTNPTPTSIVPIPSALWLFGSGLIGLVGLARRKTHA